MFTYEVEGMNDLLASFKDVERGMLDFRQLGTWKAVRSEFYKIQKEIFASEGAGKWQALSPKYAAIKLKKYGTKPILQASGEMYKEFTSDTGNVTETAQEMTIAFGPTAGYHMSKEPRKKMPYRSSLDLTDEQAARLKKPVEEKLKQLIANAKLRQLRGF